MSAFEDDLVKDFADPEFRAEYIASLILIGKSQMLSEYADDLEAFGNKIQPIDDFWEGYQRALLKEVEVVRARAEGLEKS